MKEIQFKINIQKTVDKKILDQLKDNQQLGKNKQYEKNVYYFLELRHLKERIDLEAKSIDQTANLQIKQMSDLRTCEKEIFVEYYMRRTE